MAQKNDKVGDRERQIAAATERRKAERRARKARSEEMLRLHPELAEQRKLGVKATINRPTFVKQSDQVGLHLLFKKAKDSFIKYGPCDKTFGYIRGSYEFANVVRDFGEVEAENRISQAMKVARSLI